MYLPNDFGKNQSKYREIMGQVTKKIGMLPERTTPIIMMDANAHVGMTMVEGKWVVTASKYIGAALPVVTLLGRARVSDALLTADLGQNLAQHRFLYKIPCEIRG